MKKSPMWRSEGKAFQAAKQHLSDKDVKSLNILEELKGSMIAAWKVKVWKVEDEVVKVNIG